MSLAMDYMKRIIIALALLATACDRGADNNAQAVRDTTPGHPDMTVADSMGNDTTTLTTKPMNPGRQFDAQAVKVGDQIGSVRVASKDVQAAPTTRTGVSGSVTFKGPLQLSGSYRAHYEYPQVKEACFWVDPTEWPKVPRVQRDERLIWFCFTNKDQAIQQLGPLGTNARATIVIDEYKTNLQTSDVWDTARLVRVVKKESL